ncbi:MAG: SURF1 family protein [Acidobacteria bacterium]|nr:SURF1 family protein [Acidobacteriota bacterium]
MTPVWRQRRWVVGHIICLALIIAFVNLGLWQLHRLKQRRDHNDLLQGRMAAAAQPLDRVVRGHDDVKGVSYRRVWVEWTWLPGSTMLVRSRALDERQGYHVLAVLVTGPHRGVVVNRGFAPLGGGGEDTIREAVAPRHANARVVGILRPSETRGSIGPRDPSTGRLTVLNRTDVARIQQQTDIQLAPTFVQLVSVTPSQGSLPTILPLPDASNEGPHLNYAGQWFLFATIGAIGWPFVVRRAGRPNEYEIADDVVPA